MNEKIIELVRKLFSAYPLMSSTSGQGKAYELINEFLEEELEESRKERDLAVALLVDLGIKQGLEVAIQWDSTDSSDGGYVVCIKDPNTNFHINKSSVYLFDKVEEFSTWSREDFKEVDNKMEIEKFIWKNDG